MIATSVDVEGVLLLLKAGFLKSSTLAGEHIEQSSRVGGSVLQGVLGKLLTPPHRVVNLDLFRGVVSFASVALYNVYEAVLDVAGTGEPEAREYLRAADPLRGAPGL